MSSGTGLLAVGSGYQRRIASPGRILWLALVVLPLTVTVSASMAFWIMERLRPSYACARYWSRRTGSVPPGTTRSIGLSRSVERSSTFGRGWERICMGMLKRPSSLTLRASIDTNPKRERGERLWPAQRRRPLIGARRQSGDRRHLARIEFDVWQAVRPALVRRRPGLALIERESGLVVQQLQTPLGFGDQRMLLTGLGPEGLAVARHRFLVKPLGSFDLADRLLCPTGPERGAQ